MTNARRKTIKKACWAAESSREVGLPDTVTLPAHEVMGLLNPEPEPVKKLKALRRVVRIQSNKVEPEHVFAIFDDNTIESYELETDIWGSVLFDMEQYKAEKTFTITMNPELVPTPVEDPRVEALEVAIRELREANVRLSEKFTKARAEIGDEMRKNIDLYGQLSVCQSAAHASRLRFASQRMSIINECTYKRANTRADLSKAIMGILDPDEDRG